MVQNTVLSVNCSYCSLGILCQTFVDNDTDETVKLSQISCDLSLAMSVSAVN